VLWSGELQGFILHEMHGAYQLTAARGFVLGARTYGAPQKAHLGTAAEGTPIRRPGAGFLGLEVRAQHTGPRHMLGVIIHSHCYRPARRRVITSSCVSN
jgi:hypothetical protein